MIDYEDYDKYINDALLFMQCKEETAIRKWLRKIGYIEPVGYYRDVFNRTMRIYTKHPGALIGKGGESVKMLEGILSEEFCGEWKVKFFEVGGGFVQI